MTQEIMSGQRKKDLTNEVRSTGLGGWGRKISRRDSCPGNSRKKEFSNEREVNSAKCYGEAS